jgi:AcrR family transcriptional regulator
MGRKPGVTADETRERLLASAAKVFAEEGYAGARVSEIARAAGLTTGAIYAHYATKADLLCEAIRSHGADPLLGLSSSDDFTGSVPELLQELGRLLNSRPAGHGSLLMEAAVAARRDREVAKVLRQNVKNQEALIAALLRRAQENDELSPDIPPAAAARFCMTLAMGSLVTMALGLPAPEDDDWGVVIDRLVAAMSNDD